MQKNRIVYVDVIKVFLTCLVVAHHAGQAYGPTGGVWVVSDNSSTNWLGKFFFINASYMMGLYFFISGYFMVFSLNRKSTSQFIKDRLTRLGIPLLVFTFLVFLPFNYSSAQTEKSVIAFFADIYMNKPPLATGHLWFVASLLAYSFIYILLYKESSDKKNAPVKPFKSYYIVLYIVLLTIVSAIVRLKYPIDTWRTWLIPVEVAHIPQYLSLFFIGIFFNRYQWLNSFKLSAGLFYFAVAVAAYTANDFLSAEIKEYWLMESFLESLLCVGISMTLLTFFRHYGNRSNSIIQSLSANAYGIYLFHLLIVIALQKAILPWSANANLKFTVVTILGIGLSWLLTALLRKSKMISKVI